MNVAKEIDGGEFHDDGCGDWIFGSVAILDDNVDVDYDINSTNEILR